MPIIERLVSSNIPENSKSIWHHRFGDIGEFLEVKSLEIGSGTGRVFTETLNRIRLFIEEGCSNALCGAPTHYLAGLS